MPADEGDAGSIAVVGAREGASDPGDAELGFEADGADGVRRGFAVHDGRGDEAALGVGLEAVPEGLLVAGPGPDGGGLDVGGVGGAHGGGGVGSLVGCGCGWEG